MSDKPWKRSERKVAEALDGQRIPNSGRGSPDVISARFSVEVKTRRKLPVWLWKALAQAEANCPAGKLPLVVLAESRQGVKARRVVVTDLDVFLELMKGKHCNGRCH